MTYDVVWDGSHRGTNADLLCVHPLSVKSIDPPRRGEILERSAPRWSPKAETRADLLRLLPTRPFWHVCELIEQLQVCKSTVYSIVFDLRTKRIIESV